MDQTNNIRKNRLDENQTFREQIFETLVLKVT